MEKPIINENTRSFEIVKRQFNNASPDCCDFYDIFLFDREVSVAAGNRESDLNKLKAEPHYLGRVIPIGAKGLFTYMNNLKQSLEEGELSEIIEEISYFKCGHHNNISDVHCHLIHPNYNNK